MKNITQYKETVKTVALTFIIGAILGFVMGVHAAQATIGYVKANVVAAAHADTATAPATAPAKK